MQTNFYKAFQYKNLSNNFQGRTIFIPALLAFTESQTNQREDHPPPRHRPLPHEHDIRPNNNPLHNTQSPQPCNRKARQAYKLELHRLHPKHRSRDLRMPPRRSNGASKPSLPHVKKKLNSSICHTPSPLNSSPFQSNHLCPLPHSHKPTHLP